MTTSKLAEGQSLLASDSTRLMTLVQAYKAATDERAQAELDCIAAEKALAAYAMEQIRAGELPSTVGVALRETRLPLTVRTRVLDRARNGQS